MLTLEGGRRARAEPGHVGGGKGRHRRHHGRRRPVLTPTNTRLLLHLCTLLSPVCNTNDCPPPAQGVFALSSSAECAVPWRRVRAGQSCSGRPQACVSLVQRVTSMAQRWSAGSVTTQLDCTLVCGGETALAPAKATSTRSLIALKSSRNRVPSLRLESCARDDVEARPLWSTLFTRISAGVGSPFGSGRRPRSMTPRHARARLRAASEVSRSPSLPLPQLHCTLCPVANHGSERQGATVAQARCARPAPLAGPLPPLARLPLARSLCVPSSPLVASRAKAFS